MWEGYCEIVHDNSLASDGDFWVCDVIDDAEEHWSRFYKWLFCLSGFGYEERCKMVGNFLKEVL